MKKMKKIQEKFPTHVDSGLGIITNGLFEPLNEKNLPILKEKLEEIGEVIIGYSTAYAESSRRGVFDKIFEFITLELVDNHNYNMWFYEERKRTLFAVIDEDFNVLKEDYRCEILGFEYDSDPREYEELDKIVNEYFKLPPIHAEEKKVGEEYIQIIKRIYSSMEEENRLRDGNYNYINNYGVINIESGEILFAFKEKGYIKYNLKYTIPNEVRREISSQGIKKIFVWFEDTPWDKECLEFEDDEDREWGFLFETVDGLFSLTEGEEELYRLAETIKNLPTAVR